VQRDKTAEALRSLGAEVDLISTVKAEEVKAYNIIHFWTSDIAKIKICSEVLAPKVSTIIYMPRQFRDECYSEYRRWPDSLRLHIRRAGKSLIQRLSTNSSQPPEVDQLRVVQHSDLVATIANGEAKAIRKELGLQTPCHLVPNGVDMALLGASPDAFIQRFGLKAFVLCVGRIEPQKNQLRLIQAMKGSVHRLVLLGREHPHHADYFARCKAHFSQNIIHIPHIPYNEIGSAYAASKLVVQPSYFEGVSLVSLEALLLGKSLVTTDRSYHREFYGDEVTYCNPMSRQSIRASIELGLSRLPSAALQRKIMHSYSWCNTGVRALEAYEQATILQGRNGTSSNKSSANASILES
jgi:glycosyltransferase involved in cell wall biosynthesis